MGWGGRRVGAGRKRKNPQGRRAVGARSAMASESPSIPAEPMADPKEVERVAQARLADMLPQIEELMQRHARRQMRTPETNPFKAPWFPKGAIPSREAQMAMDGAMAEASTAWLAEGTIGGLSGEGMLFLGYTYLSELAQRPEYRVISETIADDATREWIDFDVTGGPDEAKDRARRMRLDPAGERERQADPDQRRKRVERAGKMDKIKALRDDQLRLGVKDHFYNQARNDGFFGRSHLFLQIDTNGNGLDDPKELVTPIGDGRDETSRSKVPVGSFKAMQTIEPVWTYPLAYNAINPLKQDWYNPQTWYVMGQEIHGSRIPTFIGHPVPDMLKPAYAFGGLSLTQMAKPYVDIWLETRESVAAIVKSFSVMVLATDLSTMMQPGNVNALLARVAMFNMLRDNQGTFVVNKNTEDFKNVSASLAGLHELQAQAQEHMASVSRVPLVKLTGISPSGLNATSEQEIEVYDDTIMAYQSRFFAPNLSRVINFQQLSLFGEIDPEITWHFEPLRQITQAEKGQKQKDEAERDQKYVDMGALSPGEVRGRIIDDPDMPYADLDPDDVPEPPAEEADDPFALGEEPTDPNPDPSGEAADEDVDPFFGAVDGWNEADHPRAPDGMKLEKYVENGVTKYKGIPMTDAEKAAMKEAAAAKKAAKGVAQPEPPKPEPKPVAPTLPAPTAQELQQAKKSAPLQLKFLPGEKPTTAEYTKDADKIVKAFNDQWAGKTITDPAELAKKVNDFKLTQAAISVLAQADKAAQTEKIAKAKAEAEAKAKEAAAKAAEEAKRAAEKNKKIMHELGVSEQQAEGVATLAKMLGSSTGDIVEKFKGYAKQAEGLGYPITGFQCALIKNYSNGGYVEINKALRSGAWTPAQHAYVSMVNKALDGMPKFSGTCRRGANLSPEQIARYKPGHIVQEQSFTSTASAGGGFGGNVRFTVKAIGKRGASIQKLSNHPHESEVLFQARTFFKVEKVETSGGVTHVHLEEWEEH